MRDVTEQITIAQYKSGYVTPDGYDYNSYNSGNVVRSASGRSEITKSDHVSPTAYHAYRLKCVPIGYEVSGSSRRYDYYNGYRIVRGSISWSSSGLRPLGTALSRVGMNSSFQPTVPASLYSQAHNKALNNLSDSKVDLGESIGSIKSTGAMMANRLGQLASAYSAARRGNLAKAAKILGVSRKNVGKRSANSFLELQFGWLPLMNDIYNGSEAIKDAFSKGENLIRTRGVAVRGNNPSISYPYSYEGNMDQGVECGLIYRVSNSTAAGLNTLNLLNPLNIAWQLLPLSFVVDWFLSVGDFLSALSADWGLTFVGGYDTAFTKANLTLSMHLKDAWGENTSGKQPSWKISNFAMERKALLWTPPPGLYFKSPINLNQKVGTTLALVAQRL